MSDTQEETVEITRKTAVLKTSVHINEFERIWIIENFRLRNNYPWEYRNCKMLTFHNNWEKYELLLTVVSNDYYDYDSMDMENEWEPINLEIGLERISGPAHDKRVHVQLSFVYDNDKEASLVNEWSVIEANKKQIAEGDWLWSTINQCGIFSKSNDLTIKLVIKFDNGDRHEENYSDATSSICEKSLSDDLKSLVISPKFSDFKIIVSNKEFPVHRNILAARSTFFSNMFESEMRENAENTAEFDDVSPETMGEMLHYIYTGSVKRIESLMKVDLLRATDKYLLDDLNLMCVKALTKNLSVASLPNVLKLADKLEHCRHLRNSILKFITSHGKEVTDMENLGEIMQSLSPNLLSQVIKTLGQRP